MNFQAGVPAANATTTSTTVTETHVQTNLRWDASYIKTIPGMLKAAVVVINFVGFISAVCSGAYWRATSVGNWYMLVSMTGFWTSGILLVFYLLHVIEKFHVIPWLLIEFIYCAVWTFFYFSTAVDTAVHAKYSSALGAASFFGFCAMGVYAYDAFIKFKGWRAGQLAQGERTVHQSTTAEVASPTY